MKRRCNAILACGVLLLCCSTADAQIYALRAYSLSAGGGTSHDGTPDGFQVTGSIGSTDASAGPLSGGEYTLRGGFLSAVAALRTLPCLGDIDGDGDVDLADLALVLSSFGACAGNPGFNPAADFNGDGCVDLADLSLLLSRFGTTC